MARVEIMLFTGDRPAGGVLDGMPAGAWMPPGQLLTSEELAAWWSTGTPPVKFSMLTLSDQQKIKREAMRIKYLTGAVTVKEATLIKYGEGPPGNAHWSLLRDREVLEANVRGQMRQATYERSQLVSNGYDTNWGFQDLQRKLIIVADITTEELHDYMVPPDDESVHVFGKRKNLHRTRYYFPYWNHFDAATVTAIRDEKVRVDVDRAKTPFTFAEIAELIT